MERRSHLKPQRRHEKRKGASSLILSLAEPLDWFFSFEEEGLSPAAKEEEGVATV